MVTLVALLVHSVMFTRSVVGSWILPVVAGVLAVYCGRRLVGAATALPERPEED